MVIWCGILYSPLVEQAALVCFERSVLPTTRMFANDIQHNSSSSASACPVQLKKLLKSFARIKCN